MKNAIICPVCSDKSKYKNKSKISILCSKCQCLINLSAKKYNYKVNGSQNIPDKKKRFERIENSKLRFNIINKFIKNRNFFIDIGCGSGEMLEVGKFFFKTCIGFERALNLKKYYLRNNLKVYNSDCNSSILKKYKIHKNFVLFSFSHVLEHNNKVINQIRKIISEIDNFFIYIEVPLYTGLSFQTNKYNWNLWYDQHNALYSMNTLKFISKKLNLNIKNFGFRTFFSESFNWKRNIFLFLKHPLRFVEVLFTKKKENTFMDCFLKDYGYIILSSKILKK
jgi:hypothetical protein